jgi:hypothetical protein
MYELQQTIAPGDQMWVNLAELIRGGLPDRHGNFLPGDGSAVTYDLQDLTPECTARCRHSRRCLTAPETTLSRVLGLARM